MRLNDKVIIMKFKFFGSHFQVTAVDETGDVTDTWKTECCTLLSLVFIAVKDLTRLNECEKLLSAEKKPTSINKPCSRFQKSCTWTCKLHYPYAQVGYLSLFTSTNLFLSKCVRGCRTFTEKLGSS